MYNIQVLKTYYSIFREEVKKMLNATEIMNKSNISPFTPLSSLSSQIDSRPFNIMEIAYILFI